VMIVVNGGVEILCLKQAGNIESAEGSIATMFGRVGMRLRRTKASSSRRGGRYG
jgi:hypothetical protein